MRYGEAQHARGILLAISESVFDPVKPYMARQQPTTLTTFNPPSIFLLSEDQPLLKMDQLLLFFCIFSVLSGTFQGHDRFLFRSKRPFSLQGYTLGIKNTADRGTMNQNQKTVRGKGGIKTWKGKGNRYNA